MTDLSDALSSCDDSLTLQLIHERLNTGVSAIEIVAECNAGMTQLGERFDQGEAFIPDLMFSGMIMKKVMELLQPYLEAGQQTEEKKKTFVIGTVQNDIHDIGKDITAMLFRSHGFRVIDLGVDVKPEKFVISIQEYQPEFVGMSLLLTTCYQSVINTVQAIESAGCRNQIKLCVGGAAATPLLSEKANCDFYGKTAVEAVRWASAQK
ncbi:MAG: cobalamin-dependent protein [Planctomycetaceae bacterium]|jgi:5-methyltetrahydrofolate--homocysteine methyltransferase|nr:cobalamin-dependent protein [Planctomycetaceae bacterium]